MKKNYGYYRKGVFWTAASVFMFAVFVAIVLMLVGVQDGRRITYWGDTWPALDAIVTLMAYLLVGSGIMIYIVLAVEVVRHVVMATLTLGMMFFTSFQNFTRTPWPPYDDMEVEAKERKAMWGIVATCLTLMAITGAKLATGCHNQWLDAVIIGGTVGIALFSALFFLWAKMSTRAFYRISGVD